MKKIWIIVLLISIVIFPKISPYVELNNLAIIESVGVSYNEGNYTVWLKEIIPIKDEQGINYKYTYYKGNGKSVNKAYKAISLKTKKKLYLKRTKLLITNLRHSQDIINDLNIKPKSILHSTKDIYKELKEA